MAKFRNTMSNPTIDSFLLQEGTYLKAEDFEAEEEATKAKGHTRPTHDFRVQAKREAVNKSCLKKAKDSRIWSGDIIPSEGTARRYWTGIGGMTVRTTERKDALRVRRAIDSSEEKIREYA